MRFIRYTNHNEIHLGVLSQDETYVISLQEILGKNYANTMQTFIEQAKDGDMKKIQDYLESHCSGVCIEDVQLLAPMERSIHDVIAVGLNYQEHIDEADRGFTRHVEKKDPPIYFGKRTTYITGPSETVYACFDLDEKVDYEVELAVIIKKRGKDIPVEEAMDYVFGYSILNDLSSRGLQRGRIQWNKGKSLDGYTIMGPCIVSADAFDPNASHAVQCYINQELRQNGNTTQMIHKVAELISDYSQGITLEAGDIISTGTPSGVGMGFEVPKWLTEHDEMKCVIEGIGVLENKIQKRK
ncbi:2-keto-4-pentenoate hydratase/2-oxohepta-3-ene-1,7-dioic acid hydratase in catechol pathway [Breznakia blatticola]|uniref:2-keto-4-pentenoate hydratase/2-oxohepta-3-ene-1,7-dioic acid hydratase in catechol pathway n=1 Tax=Breznakia blatticola TaxID=1754012 RepID=A0A4R7ZXY4_9FIRM|nr:fumarylacetoacetate hydrolase family protein [Breznakia blatticola]TDW20560.1 2-keto-4-pentenoate hydratase/2-oxohepta-3-ene-1,7-dioic acid hydratase in catechol pathway [Breznakia blatticola]